MANIVLHIGRHKSGTSSLQLFLSNNQEWLNNRGYKYPVSLRSPIAHHPLARHFNPNIEEELSTDELSRFWMEIDRPLNSIISSEAFQNIHPKILKKTFEEHNLRIIVYLREQIAYFLSAYSQSIKARKVTWTMEEFEKQSFHANYEKFLSRWYKCFINSDIRVGLFDRSALVNGNIIDDFLVRSDITDENDLKGFEKISEDNNPSIGGQLLEFKRLLNFTDYDKFIKPARLYKTLQTMATVNESYCLNKKIPEKLYNKILSDYTKSNQVVSDKYLGVEIPMGRGAIIADLEVISGDDLDNILVNMAEVDDELSSLIRTRYYSTLLNML